MATITTYVLENIYQPFFQRWSPYRANAASLIYEREVHSEHILSVAIHISTNPLGWTFKNRQTLEKKFLIFLLKSTIKMLDVE